MSEQSSTKRNLLGVLVDATTYGDVVERVVAAARDRRGLSVSATAVHGVMEGVLDRAHGARLNAFDIITPDGQPVRWALRWLHRDRLRERVYGPRLMLEICTRAAAGNLPIYLYGSTPGVLDQLRERLLQQVPGLVIAGFSPSRFGTLDRHAQQEVARTIRESGASVVFVGLGCPRQETFCWAMRDQVSRPLLAVGAAFDFHAGLQDEPPEWMQRWGLQWLQRLAQEPRRLWRRYVLLNPAYLTLVAAQLTGAWRPVPAPAAPPEHDAVPG